jgi:hypothetical protein
MCLAKMQPTMTTMAQRNLCKAIAVISKKHSTWTWLHQKLPGNWQMSGVVGQLNAKGSKKRWMSEISSNATDVTVFVCVASTVF